MTITRIRTRAWAVEGSPFVIILPDDKKTYRLAPRDAQDRWEPKRFRSFEAAVAAAQGAAA